MAIKRKLLELTVFIVCVFRVGRSEEDKLVNHCKTKFENCECTDFYIYCDNQGLTDITLLQPYINKTISSIILKGNDFKELPKDLFQACSDELPYLTNLELSSSNIKVLPENSFQCLDKLEKLSLRNNSLKVDSFLINFHISNNTLKRLNLSYAFDNSHGSLDSKKLGVLLNTEGLSRLERLDLSGNGLLGLYYDAGTALCDLYALKQLNLSHNNISNAMIRECMGELEILDLSYNQISELTPSLMDSLEALFKLKEIRLDNNPYICNCYVQGTVDWLKSTLRPVDKNSITCKEGDVSVKNKPFLDIKNISGLYCPEPNIAICPPPPLYAAGSSMVYVLGAAGVLLVAGSVVIALFLVRRRRRRKYTQNTVSRKIPPYKPLV